MGPDCPVAYGDIMSGYGLPGWKAGPWERAKWAKTEEGLWTCVDPTQIFDVTVEITEETLDIDLGDRVVRIPKRVIQELTLTQWPVTA